MDTFSPEFAQQWLAGRSTDDTLVEQRTDEGVSPSQQEALDALANRICAARSVY
jgi:hypothetical protein